MYGKTKLLDVKPLSKGSNELCKFECLNCGAKIQKPYKDKDTKHRCSSFKKEGNIDLKWCFKCSKWLEFAFFQKAKDVFGGLSKVCRTCRQIYMNKAESKRKSKDRKFYETTGLLPKTKIRSLVANALNRAIRAELPIDINADYIEELWQTQNGLCYYTHKKMKWAKEKVSFFSPSLDRLDPSKGYIKGNVVLCLFAINSFKQELNVSDFLDFVNSVSEWGPRFEE